MITVFGAGGFIGSHLVRHLRDSGIEHRAPARDELPSAPLGHVIYCIGLTADFRTRPLDTVEAHVCRLLDVVRTCTFDSLLYLSSTRLLSGRQDLYNLSKATGEALVLSIDGGRVARLSNVYGPGQSPTFLTEIVEEAETRGSITLRTTLDSAKDYVSVDDAVRLLVQIALHGRERVYNVASGVNVTNEELTAAIARRTGCKVTVAPDAERIVFPPVDVAAIRAEFGFTPSSIKDYLK